MWITCVVASSRLDCLRFVVSRFSQVCAVRVHVLLYLHLCVHPGSSRLVSSISHVMAASDQQRAPQTQPAQPQHRSESPVCGCGCVCVGGTMT